MTEVLAIFGWSGREEQHDLIQILLQEICERIFMLTPVRLKNSRSWYREGEARILGRGYRQSLFHLEQIAEKEE
jgi:hypothetical protein